jgi:UPF0755 protein
MSKRKILAIGLLVLLVAGLVKSSGFIWFAFAPAKPNSQESKIIEVHKRQSPNEITQILHQDGIISDSLSFVLLGRITRQWGRLKAGEYKVSPAMSPIEILSVITSGISIAHPLTIREGENMYEIATELQAKGLVQKDEFLDLCKDKEFIATLGFGAGNTPATLEGFLYPDTYFFNKTMTTEDMIRRMVKRFDSAWGAEQTKLAKQMGFTQLQVITLASIIEKETGVASERPLVSSVFHNRLKKKMRLQSDPTTIYGLGESYKGNIHKNDLATKNPYNTYTIPGLPIGPIGNPGKEAIDAALSPAKSDYLFFVSHNDGTHQFSETLKQHNDAVKKFQMDRKAREGKSWRDYYNSQHIQKKHSS